MSYAIAILGIFTSAIIILPIRGAYQTIEQWLVKQRILLTDKQELLKPFALKRDVLQKRSMHYISRYAPFAFILFWLLGIVATFYRR